MNARIGGVTTTTTFSTEVTDFGDLGRFLADQSNIEQTDLLAGLSCALQEDVYSGDNGILQVAYIAETVETHNEREAIRWFVRELHARINTDELPQ